MSRRAWSRAGLAGGIGLTLAMMAGPALAQNYPASLPPDQGAAAVDDTAVLGEQQVRPAAVQAAAQESLPVTGGDLAGLAAIGAGAVGVGTVLVRRGRRVTV